MQSQLKIFRLNDYDWWAGFDLESVKSAYVVETGMDAEESFDEAGEISDAELDALRFHDEDGSVITFTEQLNRMTAEGQKFPCQFASTEY